jgi:tetratricopeptide (TPR) repeat protein
VGAFFFGIMPVMLAWIRSKLGAAGRTPAQLLSQAEAAYSAGAPEQARRLSLGLLRRSPRDGGALALLAAIAADAGQTEEGLQWARRAQAADPGAASPHYVMGRLWQDAARLVDAEASYRIAIGLQPDHARAHNNLGCVLHMQGKLQDALVAYRRALDLDAGLPQANQNYAAIVRDAGALERAAAAYLRHTAAHPGDAMAFNDLGNAYRELGRHQDALAAYERALALAPGLAQAHFSRSFVLLLLGDYSAGWRDYEWRWRISAFNGPVLRFSQPIWDGSRIEGSTLLLHAEQGLGDTLQFVRYASRAAERCESVILECQPELVALLRSTAGLGRVLAKGEPLPPFVAHAPLMSLPALFGTTLDNIPWSGPYVHADPERVAAWRDAIAEPGLKVGLVWAGRPQQWDDRKRSISLHLLAPLARVPRVAFYSLQVGVAATQAARPPESMRLIDVAARIKDFSDTAAIVAGLDLVITIDTSVAHLAGAMGVPVWVLVAHAPDWRYHLVRSDNPWYPTMRLFRQERDGDWNGAIEQVAAALQQRAARS